MANIFNLVVGLEIRALLAVECPFEEVSSLVNPLPSLCLLELEYDKPKLNETFADTRLYEQTRKQFEKGKAYHGTSLESESVREKVTPCG